jgi:acetyltransferase-like isoleucine patch superfamily enzyme
LINLLGFATVAARQFKKQAIRRILSYRVQARHPSLNCDPTAIWDYGYDNIEAIELGVNVTVLAHVEVVVQRKHRHTSIDGRLVIGDGATLALGANIRAAGGIIAIGALSGIGQYSVLVAANHTTVPGLPYFSSPWDENRTGIEIGRNVWVAAGCVILPGVTIGDNAVIGAGSVVNQSVPADELWAGVPARRIKALP